MSIGALVSDGVLWLALPVAMLAGLVSFLSPCVLPLVPGYLGFIGGAVTASSRSTPAAERAQRDEAQRDEPHAQTTTMTDAPTRGRLLLGVVLFIAGFTLVFMAVNILGGAAGRFFIEYADAITRVMGAIVIVMGLVFIGVFGLAQRTMRPQLRGNLGLIGAPLLGVALGIGWTPCIGPTLAAVQALAFSEASAERGALLTVAYCLGLGVPFLAAGLAFRKAMGVFAWVKAHYRWVMWAGGGMMVATGVLMVTGIWSYFISYMQSWTADYTIGI